MHQATSSRFAAPFQSLKRLKLTHNFEREALFVAALGLAAFYYTALLTFSPLDTSPVAASFPPVHTLNRAGAIGAIISGLAYYQTGLAAYLLPLPFVVAAALLAFKAHHALSVSRLCGWIIGLPCAAYAAASFCPPFMVSGYALPAGGVVGSLLVAVLTRSLGSTGSQIIVATAACCSLMLVFRQSLLDPARTLGARLPNPLAIIRERQAANPKERPLVNPPQVHREPMTIGSHIEPGITTVPDGLAEPNKVPKVPNREAPAEPTPVSVPSPGLMIRTIDPPETSNAATKVNEPIDELLDDGSMDPLTLPSRMGHEPRPRQAYLPPPVAILQRSEARGAVSAKAAKDYEATGELLEKTFSDFGISGKVVAAQPGPVVTVFEFEPDAGVKQAKVMSLIDDLALALRVDSIFIHPVRGKRALGIQVPNTRRDTVYLGDVIASDNFANSAAPLTIAMGKSLAGEPVCADLSAMPHLLAAGATGSGKSVAINTILCSIIMKASPEDVRMILVDPKMLELSVYEGIPHLLMPVITEPSRASLALKWAAHEMERRYRLMQVACVRNIAGFNVFWDKAPEARKREIREAVGDFSIDKLPYILLVIDELADLMMTAPKDVEATIQRLAQKARASGIHLVLATQRPSVDIITGVIKANLPCRIAFQTVSKHDSRTILDLVGAEKLLGKGDLLFQRPGTARLERIQGAFVGDDEVLNLVAEVKSAGKVAYDQAIISWIDDELARQSSEGDGGEAAHDETEKDPKFDEAIAIASSYGVVSASFLQRHLKIGYNRAARLVEYMEAKGLVAKADGSKPRRWLGPNASASV